MIPLVFWKIVSNDSLRLNAHTEAKEKRVEDLQIAPNWVTAVCVVVCLNLIKGG